MNKIEAFVYGLVKNNYIVKNALRNIYQGFYDLLPNYESWFLHRPVVKPGCFFGFHDVTPFSLDNQRLLANRLTIPLRMPTADDVLEVGFFSGKDYEEWHKVAETRAWNYHKGCRLQWRNSKEVIFNIAEGAKVKSAIVNVDNGNALYLGWPIDTISPDGALATSFSYERLQTMMPGYGYVYSDDDAYLDQDVTEKTGLFLIDVASNQRKLLLSLQSIAEFEHEATMDDAFHFVTHTEFSPDSRYVSFLHRWYRGTFQKTRLMVYDLQTKSLWASPTSGMVSHYVWNNLNGIVAYCRIADIDSHVYFTDNTMKHFKRCGYPQLNSDGHHSFVNDREFVVDTYPDKRRHAKIYKVNIDTDKVELVADCRSYKKFASPTLYKHWACDLHPRCSRDGSLLSFDSVFVGERSLCVMKL